MIRDQKNGHTAAIQRSLDLFEPILPGANPGVDSYIEAVILLQDAELIAEAFHHSLVFVAIAYEYRWAGVLRLSHRDCTSTACRTTRAG